MDFGLANLNKRYVFHATIQEYSLDSEWSKTKQDNVWKPIIKLSNIAGPQLRGFLNLQEMMPKSAIPNQLLV